MKHKIKNSEDSDIIRNYEKNENGDIEVNFLDGSVIIADPMMEKSIEIDMEQQAEEFTKDTRKLNMLHTMKTALLYYSELFELDSLMPNEELSDKIKYSYYLKNKDVLNKAGVRINDVDSYLEKDLKQKVKSYK